MQYSIYNATASLTDRKSRRGPDDKATYLFHIVVLLLTLIFHKVFRPISFVMVIINEFHVVSAPLLYTSLFAKRQQQQIKAKAKQIANDK